MPTTLRAYHRPLLLLVAGMALLAVVAVIGLVADAREVTGLSAWAKPLKFALSTAIYALTLAWLLSLLPPGRRLAWRAGTAASVGLTVELVIITGAAVTGTTSHFNVSSPVAAALWSTMAGFIGLVWIAQVVVGISLFRAPLGDPARTLAIRAGVVIGIGGMALGFLMTAPTSAQLADFRGIAGAHTVGVPDGSPGLPILGWSTVAGDLRIPHFVGMHALQIIPLACWTLELAGRRIPVLARAGVRARLVAIGTAAFVAGLTLVTYQALAGQSIVRPDAVVASLAIGIVAAASLASIALLARAAKATPSLARQSGRTVPL
jgi:hypothetical protein